MYLFMYTPGLAILCLTAAAALANLEIRPAGWLDRLVKYQKEHFIKDVNEKTPVHIQASIQSRPAGYVDSSAWDFASVSHLLSLIEESPGASVVRSALRRMKPTRRFMSRPQSFKHFPSLSKNSLNYIYYQIESAEMDYDEDGASPSILDPDAVLVIANPVEARLPSAQISVTLLKTILEARAVAARIMPSTTKANFIWITRLTTTPAPSNDSPVTATDTAPGEDGVNNGDETTGAGNHGNETTTEAGDLGSETTTAAGNDETTAEAAT